MAKGGGDSCCVTGSNGVELIRGKLVVGVVSNGLSNRPIKSSLREKEQEMTHLLPKAEKTKTDATHTQYSYL